MKKKAALLFSGGQDSTTALGWSLRNFDEIYLLTQGGPGTATEVVSFSIYETYFESDNIGLGSAMSVTTLILIILIMYVVQKIYIKLRLNTHD